MKKITMLSILFLATFTSCLYQMPTDECISTLPHINNPMFTREKPSSLMPGGRA